MASKALHDKEDATRAAPDCSGPGRSQNCSNTWSANCNIKDSERSGEPKGYDARPQGVDRWHFANACTSVVAAASHALILKPCRETCVRPQPLVDLVSRQSVLQLGYSVTAQAPLHLTGICRTCTVTEKRSRKTLQPCPNPSGMNT